MKIRSTLLLRAGLVTGALGFLGLIGCQGQTEGERCSLLNGSADCVGDLVCTAASTLRADDGVNRCCPDGGTPTDDRCARRISGGDGTGGSGGLGGASGSGGSTIGSGGTSGTSECRYTSDCDDGLVCGPTGQCQAECQDDIDCDDGLVCSSDQRCVSPTP